MASRVKTLERQGRAQGKQLKALFPKGPKQLSEQQQMAQFKQRALKGHAGFEDVTQQHGLGGLQRYLKAMADLHKKHGVPMPETP